MIYYCQFVVRGTVIDPVYRGLSSTLARSWERKKDVQSHTYTGEYPTNRVYEFEIALLMGRKNVNFLRQAETLRTRFPDTFS